MKIHAPTAFVGTPLGEKNYIEGSFVFDTMSGASPHYLHSLSGASEVGIKDNRRAWDLKLTHMFERFSIGLGGHMSDEDDYTSRGGAIESKVWSSDKNTTLALGLSVDSDEVGSSQDPAFSEDRRTFNYLLGITQVLSAESIVQSNITYSSARGYQSDVYKALDNRPQSRGMWAWLTRYNRFFQDMESSLHVDYRLYTDTWDVLSHMFEVAWYQPLGQSWMVRPFIRYYSQGAAQFFEDNFPPSSERSFFSADQRLGDFGSIGGGLNLAYDFGSGLSVDASVESFLQKPSLKLGGGGSDNIEDFYAWFFSIGLAKKF